MEVQNTGVMKNNSSAQVKNQEAVLSLMCFFFTSRIESVFATSTVSNVFPVLPLAISIYRGEVCKVEIMDQSPP